MADDITWDITGLEESIDALNKLKDKVAKVGLRAALKAGITVIGNEIKSRTPVKTGLLKEFCQTTVSVTKRDGGVAKVSYGTEGYIARFVETGHRIIPREAHGLKRQQRIEASTGDVPPHPFMRPGLDATKERAVEAFAKAVETTVAEAGKLGLTGDENQ